MTGGAITVRGPAAALLALVLSACGVASSAPPAATSSTEQAVVATTTTGPSANARPELSASGPAPLPAGTVAPTTISIPSIGVSAALDSLTLDSGDGLERPPNADRPGWFSGSAIPGDGGPAVIAGHVDSKTGPAVFWRLRELAVGDTIVVTRSDATAVTFRVTRTAQYPQSAFPTREVYGPTPDRALRLITCAGTYDKQARRYRDNRVVFAVAT